MSKLIIFDTAARVSDMFELWLQARKANRYNSPNLELVNAMYLIHLEMSELNGYFPADPFEIAIVIWDFMAYVKKNRQSTDEFKRLVTKHLEEVNEDKLEKLEQKQRKTA